MRDYDPSPRDMLSGREVLDLAGIAEFLGVAPTTPQQWRQRGQLVEPDPTISKPDKPLWRRDAIETWARSTERWPPGRVARPRKVDRETDG